MEHCKKHLSDGEWQFVYQKWTLLYNSNTEVDFKLNWREFERYQLIIPSVKKWALKHMELLFLRIDVPMLRSSPTCSSIHSRIGTNIGTDLYVRGPISMHITALCQHLMQRVCMLC